MTERQPPDDVPAHRDRPHLGGPEPAVEFGRLFDTYARPLHRYLARRVGQDAAHDLVSETFLVALNQRHDYDPRRGVVRSWLYGIATNLLRRRARDEVRGLRAAARSAGHAAGQDSGHDNAVAARVDAAAMAARLAGALAGLSEGDRDVLLLTSWAGLDSNEVADALGIPVGTVRSRLHRVRRSLRATAPREETGDE
ncbi:RNA polymerase sigma factor [Actinophytocola gossypii]|uniref:Sigma-70 family RNA polymerase sigma factor n=1 Tax=Actinophytocola gossypii TaxID=2812003 RepID=A0ABT2J408_9PSEU|nr:sigma-70 family RNA polymerase sigma factor [Actinophytocola gossypii]MCT2582591.1 sigma-70 family RNA polymerase sigma factor [Actinophytocola gossypii]